MANLVLGAGGAAAEAYTIDQSLRCENADSAYLSRTVGTPTSARIGTLSFWAKKVVNGTEIRTFGNQDDTNNRFYFSWASGDYIEIVQKDGGSTTMNFATTALYRDPSAWYHVVFTVDVSQGVEANRCKLYINGDQVTAFDTATYPSQDVDQPIFDAVNMFVAAGKTSSVGAYFDGYLAEFYYMDGTAYDADDFAETDEDTNQWKPIDASGLTFGTNGFYQKYASTELANSFTDSSTVFSPTEGISVDYLIVGGGASGGVGDGGGGGAGGYRTGTSLSLTSGTDYTVLVGQGGTGQTSSDSNGNNGDDSYISGSGLATITSTGGGGGGGGGSSKNNDGQDGGSGGGGGGHASSSSQAGGSGNTPSTSPSQGNDGGDGASSGGKGGGGGGSSAVGNDGDVSDGAGGAGTSNSITGSAVTYAAGGNGDNNQNVSPDATANSGNGSNGTDSGSQTTGDGGSGVVIISYISTTEKATGGTITSYVDGSDTYQVHTFTRTRHTITANGDVANTRAEQKVGDSSIYFDADGAYLTIPDSSDWDIDFSSSWTWEFWMNAVVPPEDYAGIICHNVDDNYSPGWGIVFNTASYLMLVSLATHASSAVESSSTIPNGGWHHYAFVHDNSADTMKLYIDGALDATGSTTAITLPDVTGVLTIGRHYVDDRGFEGYLDEIRLSDTARYTGTFTPQTTEFTADSNTMLLIHSDFDGGLGADSSGNENDFAVTNLVATDQMKDSPTNNFCTMDPVDKLTVTLSEGNLQVSGGSGGQEVRGTIAKDTGKWYYEMYLEARPSASDQVIMGVGNIAPTAIGSVYAESVAYRTDANKYVFSASSSSYGATWTAGDIIGVAMNLEDEEVTFYKDNSTQGAISFTLGTNVLTPFCRTGASSGTDELIFNFGQDSSFAGNKTAGGNADSNGVGDFFYEPPSLFLALCTSNLSDPSIKKPGAHFNTVLYTGDGATTLAVTGAGFAPDFLWIKERSSTRYHRNVDAVRGAHNFIATNTDTAEIDDSTQVNSLDSDGFTVGDASETNTNTETYVAWNWKAGGAAVDNDDGTIDDALVSANTTAGFSVVKYTGNDTSGATVGHGLAQVPELIIVKDIDAVKEWAVYSSELTSNNYYLVLNTNAAQDTDTGRWNDTTPTASVFSLGNSSVVNTTDDYIAYCFHSIENFSKVGSYEGNANADGSFVYTGFRPALIMIKNIDATANWHLYDDKRVGYNVSNWGLFPNSSDGEDVGTEDIDIVSNGFKLRRNSVAFNNANTYLYYACAESPFKYANAR